MVPQKDRWNTNHISNGLLPPLQVNPGQAVPRCQTNGPRCHFVYVWRRGLVRHMTWKGGGKRKLGRVSLILYCHVTALWTRIVFVPKIWGLWRWKCIIPGIVIAAV